MHKDKLAYRIKKNNTIANTIWIVTYTTFMVYYYGLDTIRDKY